MVCVSTIMLPMKLNIGHLATVASNRLIGQSRCIVLTQKTPTTQQGKGDARHLFYIGMLCSSSRSACSPARGCGHHLLHVTVTVISAQAAAMPAARGRCWGCAGEQVQQSCRNQDIRQAVGQCATVEGPQLGIPLTVWCTALFTVHHHFSAYLIAAATRHLPPTGHPLATHHHHHLSALQRPPSTHCRPRPQHTHQGMATIAVDDWLVVDHIIFRFPGDWNAVALASTMIRIPAKRFGNRVGASCACLLGKPCGETANVSHLSKQMPIHIP